jgi:UDP-2-acetamido-2-deoxy-ribo-hexuluronate aminotransferase
MLDRGSFSISPEQYIKLDSQNKTIPFIDLKTQQDIIRPQLENNIHKVLHHGKYIMGPEVQQLEEKLADFVGVKHCIGISSGTDALLIAMMALGIKPGDEVITTPFTFIATGEMIALLGAKPVFVDIDPKTYNIDPNKIEQVITKKTKAIIPVSLYGQCADFDEINAIAEKYQLPMIEDAAQSLGASYKGKQSGSLTTIACTSFFPSKPLGAYGDAGACFTDNDDLARLMREIRVHGQDKRYHHPRIGINGRLDTIQAAILLAKLEIFPEEVEKRKIIADNYTKLITESCTDIIPPHIKDGNTSVYAQYTIQVNNREQFIQKFKEANIQIAIHYPVPLNLQPALETNEFELSNAIDLSGKVMSLPMHPYLTESEQQRIVDILK